MKNLNGKCQNKTEQHVEKPNIIVVLSDTLRTAYLGCYGNKYIHTPCIDEFAKQYDASQIKIGKLNVDENSAMAGKFGVMSIPTFLVFKNGEVVDQAVGGVGKEKLQELIDKNL